MCYNRAILTGKLKQCPSLSDLLILQHVFMLNNSIFCIYIITDQLNVVSVKCWDYGHDKCNFLCIFFPLLSSISHDVCRSFASKTFCNCIPWIIFKYFLARFEWIVLASHSCYLQAVLFYLLKAFDIDVFSYQKQIIAQHKVPDWIFSYLTAYLYIYMLYTHKIQCSIAYNII